MKQDIVIIGFGGHAKVVADSIEQTGEYRIVGYTDVEKRNSNYHYIGSDDELIKLFQKGVKKAVIGLGYLGSSNMRDEIISFASNIGYEFPVICDPTAIIAKDVVVDEGTYIGKNVVINADSRVGKFCIINTGSIIEHENSIGDCSHISVGTILCGKVSVGHHAMIGAGATVIQCKIIGNNCIVGANSTVLSDVENNMRVKGIVKQETNHIESSVFTNLGGGID